MAAATSIFWDCRRELCQSLRDDPAGSPGLRRFDDPGNVSVNGQRETANAFLVNGGDVSEGRNLGAGLVPNLDSIEEFRLITNSFDAEYGKFSGAVMNAITKSGTNGFHGTFSSSCATIYSTPAIISIPSRSELRRNQFGYAVGGPFWKNQLFWFTDYQGTARCWREHRSRAGAQSSTSATATSVQVIFLTRMAIR